MNKYIIKPNQEVKASRLATMQSVILQPAPLEIYQLMGNVSRMPVKNGLQAFAKLINEDKQIILVPLDEFNKKFEKVPFGLAPLIRLLKYYGVKIR